MIFVAGAEIIYPQANLLISFDSVIDCLFSELSLIYSQHVLFICFSPWNLPII